MATLEKAKTLEEKRAALIIKYRDMTVDSVEKDEENKIIYRLSKDDKKYLMEILLNLKTIGIAYIRELRDKIAEEEVDGGIIVGDGKYTYSARSNAPEMSIELIPKSLPTFDIFEHALVPLHVILSKDERNEIAEKYHAEPYQFPWVKASDPISIIIGAKPGDVVRVIQKSQTAGRYEGYRYVV
jgi:DNA-directed RNA polymerase subunit H (RpoH/RPB5)